MLASGNLEIFCWKELGEVKAVELQFKALRKTDKCRIPFFAWKKKKQKQNYFSPTQCQKILCYESHSNETNFKIPVNELQIH